MAWKEKMQPIDLASLVIYNVLLLQFCLSTNAEGISCYKCTILPPIRISNMMQPVSQLCSQFDESSRFQVFCPTSTFCMKKTFHLKLANGTIVTSVLRDCASQRHLYQSYSFKEAKWKEVEEVVKTAYNEGCFTEEDHGTPAGPPEYCYCSYHLCNESPSNQKSSNIFVNVVLMLGLLICIAQVLYL
ncbi:uncharacterized protein LOC105696103 [Orussus abietinus]|uniref:uncharacterized protein LOC105696103 n=1 Tax=Orussus abietinus TaxID=222816 RepID=UPI000625F998|nr:uncharacterized protein LOC105696103 [Orussus abietinus]